MNTQCVFLRAGSYVCGSLLVLIVIPQKRCVTVKVITLHNSDVFAHISPKFEGLRSSAYSSSKMQLDWHGGRKQHNYDEMLRALSVITEPNR